MKKVKEECWAVMNMNLGLPCTQTTGTGEKMKSHGPAIFMSDIEGFAKEKARAWKEENLPDFPDIEVVPIEIRY